MIREEEAVLDIERRLRSPVLAAKVQRAEKEHAIEQRRREKLRAELTQALAGDIHCQWLDGEPVKWEIGRASVTFSNGATDVLEVDPYEEVDGKRRLKSDVVRNGYQAVVEGWALWKWNTARGAEIDERDQYIFDVEPPAFVWDEPIQTPATPKRGRPRKVEAA